MLSAASPIWQLPNMLPIFLLLPVPFFLSPIYKRAECYWIRNPPPPSPLTISLFYFPYQRLRLIYSSSFACGLDLLEFKPYSTMMTRGKRSSTATASSTQVKRREILNTVNFLSGSFIIYSLKRAISGLIFILLLVFYYSTTSYNNNNNNLITSRALFTFTDQQRLTT